MPRRPSEARKPIEPYNHRVSEADEASRRSPQADARMSFETEPKTTILTMDTQTKPLSSPIPLAPLPYHRDLQAFLETHEPDLWKWHASDESKDEHADATRLQLLKSAYRMDREAHGGLYRLADEARAALNLEVSVTLYQAQDAEGMNALLMFLPGEAHIIFQGPLLKTLSAEEQQAVLGHELSHHLLWTLEGGKYFTARRVLESITAHPEAAESYVQSLRLFQLYTELFADRGATIASGSPLAAIGCLVKISTGLTDADPASYIRQADEIFSNKKAEIKTEGLTHPESFIRARALNLWAHSGSEADPDTEQEIKRMLEGRWALDELDVLAQRELSALTRQLLQVYFKPTWIRTDALLAHARLFFEDFEASDQGFDEADLWSRLAARDKRTTDYLCYLLFDFVAVDRDLDEAPLAAALLLAKRLDSEERFAEIARKELKLTKKVLTRIQKDKEQIVGAAEGQKV